MEMLNRATEEAAAFKDLLRKMTHNEALRVLGVRHEVSPEIAAWNTEVDRKRAEKKARKAQHTKALDGLR